jgi:colanic acid biosynthesis glycosyl transferase WcaI
MKKRHVLFLTYHLPVGEQPGAFRPWMEARLLARTGFVVTVITSGVQYMTGENIRPTSGWCTEEHIEGIRILKTWAPSDHRRSLFRRVLNYSSFALLAGLIALLKVREVHRVFAGTDPLIMMPIVYLISCVKRAPMIIDERDLYPETVIALGVMREGLFSRMLFAMQQFFRKRAHRIVAATPGIRRKLLDYGFSSEKVRLLYNADVFLHEPSVDGSRRCLDLRRLTGKRFLVGYAGGLGPANDIPTLLRSAEHLKNRNDLGVIIIGSGENRHRYINYCEEHDLDNVYFLEAVPRYEARKLVRQMDICVQPLCEHPHFQHTLTSKTFDYHGLGVPMIVSGEGDTPELLRASGGGLAVGPGDDARLAEAIKFLIQNGSLRRRMGQSAIKWFQENISIESACSVIKSVLNVESAKTKGQKIAKALSVGAERGVSNIEMPGNASQN